MAGDCLAGDSRAEKGKLRAPATPCPAVQRPASYGPIREISVNDQPAARPAKKPAPQFADYPHQVTDNHPLRRPRSAGPRQPGGVSHLFRDRPGGDVPRSRSRHRRAGLTFVMVRMEVDYVKELHWPGIDRHRHRRRRIRPLLVQGLAGDLPRRRVRRDRQGHAGLHGYQDAQGDAAAGRSDRAAQQVEDSERVKNSTVVITGRAHRRVYARLRRAMGRARNPEPATVRCVTLDSGFARLRERPGMTAERITPAVPACARRARRARR